MRYLLIGTALALGFGAAAQDAYLTNCFVPRYWKANTGWQVSARVRNSSSSAPLYTFHVDYRFNNGPVQVGNTQATTGISPGQYWPYVHQVPFSSAAGSGVLKVWVVGGGETNPSNDTLYFDVKVLGAWATKSVLIEQTTGTWCQFCPPSDAVCNTLDADPLIVVASHHENDQFTSASSAAYWAPYVVGYTPAGLMEQGEFGGLPVDAQYTLWQERADMRKMGVSPASVVVTPVLDLATRELTVDAAVAFEAAVPGTYTLNAYVLEDQVHAPQTGAGADYVHMQIVREVLGGADGTTGVIPASPAAGTTYTHQYTTQVPEGWDAANLRVAVMISEHGSGGLWTVNVADANVLAVGIVEQEDLRFSVAPNPATDAVRINLPDASAVRVRLIDAKGAVVLDRDLRAASGSFVLDGLDAFPGGLYTLRVSSQGREGSHGIVLH
ncbi:MAG: Omp28-related outer membrane protein [Flavobacteriales bacterium]|nr:Omp28-related outer membrane protein [Flavobacteriales bacterium]